MSILSKPYFHDEEAAIKYLESIVWTDGVSCPHCKTSGRVYDLKGKTTRPGLKKCGACRKQFTVKVGTIFESSHIPLHKWFQASYLMACSKKGISAHQLHRILEITYKSAWFMCHRIREAMKDDPKRPLGFLRKDPIVELDETYIGGKEKNKHKHKRLKGTGGINKMPVLSLVQRGGDVRSFHAPVVTAEELRPIVYKHVYTSATLMTDEALIYPAMAGRYKSHEAVKHNKGEYVRGKAHTNTAENYFSILKRGIIGVFHHVSAQHLPKYLAEFDCRYNQRMVSDHERFNNILANVVGRRLRYREKLSTSISN